jgi:hypothetical protein
VKITLTDGAPLIDAHDLGPLLDLAPADVPEKMRNGAITSRFETGVDADAGLFRLTFYHAGTRLRLTCTAEGEVLTTTRTPVGKKP